MAQISWMFWCEHGFLDEAQRPCLIGIFRHVILRQVPGIINRAMLAIAWWGNPGEQVQAELQVYDARSVMVASTPLAPIRIGQMGEGISFVLFDGFQFQVTGWHRIEVGVPGGPSQPFWFWVGQG
ncbi:MAG: hypothetical protein K6U87_09650 [Firmicutes bacterium]|nr:hypothetical protein [Bacillota bacterium]